MAYGVPDFKKLGLHEFGTEEDVKRWGGELFELIDRNEDRNVIRAWYDKIRRTHSPKLLGYQQCLKEFPVFQAVPENLPLEGRVVAGCDVYLECTK